MSRELAENSSLAEKAVIHTVEDYYALLEEWRAELIDGVFTICRLRPGFSRRYVAAYINLSCKTTWKEA